MLAVDIFILSLIRMSVKLKSIQETQASLGMSYVKILKGGELDLIARTKFK